MGFLMYTTEKQTITISRAQDQWLVGLQEWLFWTLFPGGHSLGGGLKSQLQQLISSLLISLRKYDINFYDTCTYQYICYANTRSPRVKVRTVTISLFLIRTLSSPKKITWSYDHSTLIIFSYIRFRSCNIDSSDLPMPPFSTSEELETNSISVSL